MAGPSAQRPQPIPKRPYRDSAVLHLVLAAIIVVVAWLTGGDLPRALVFAAVFFVFATAWTWWRWSRRLASERANAGAPRR